MNGFEYACNIKNQCLHHFVSVGQMSPQLAQQIGAEFNNSSVGFSNLINELCAARRTDPTDDIIVEAVKIAIDQIHKNLTSNQFNFNTGQMSTGMVGAPNYGGGYSSMSNPFSSGQQKQPSSLSLQGSGTRQIVFETRTNKPTIQNTITYPIVEQTVEKNYEQELKTHTGSKGASIKFMDLADDAQATNYNRKVALRVEGSTKKRASNLYSINRTVIEVNEDGTLSWIQFDKIDFTNHLIFDSGHDLVQFINSNLSTSDIKQKCMRIVTYEEMVPYDYDYDEFKEEYNKIVEYMRGAYTNHVDLLTRWEELKEHLTILESRVIREVFNLINSFLVDEINRHMKKVLRFNRNIEFIIQIEHLKDLETILIDKNFISLRDNSKFEPIMNHILDLIVGFFTKTGPLKFLDLETTECFDHYVRSRKLMDMEASNNAFTCDYYKYSENSAIQHNLIAKMKERVVMVAPRRSLIAKLYSPNFIRQAMMTMVQKPFIIPFVDVNNVNNSDDLIYLIIHKISNNNVNHPIPEEMFYMLDDRGNFKQLDISYTIEKDIIIN